MMSAKSTAASTSWRRTGCSVTSAQSSGVPATSKNEWPSRIARYSGSERPAWRMNHTGVRSTCSRRAARTRSGAVTAYTSPAMNASGPLVARWRSVERAPVAGGRARLATSRGGERRHAPPWRTRGVEDGLFLATTGSTSAATRSSGTGVRTPLERTVAPGETLRQLVLAVRAPIPPGRYRLAVDLVEEHRFWLAELGNRRSKRTVDVAPRDASERARVSAETPSRATTGTRARASCTRRATPPSAARSRRGASPSLRRTPPAAAAIRAFRIRSFARRSCRRSSRTRGRGPAGLPARGRRAVDVRRRARAQTSIAIWSSTRVKTSAPSASATAHATTR